MLLRHDPIRLFLFWYYRSIGRMTFAVPLSVCLLEWKGIGFGVAWSFLHTLVEIERAPGRALREMGADLRKVGGTPIWVLKTPDIQVEYLGGLFTRKKLCLSQGALYREGDQEIRAHAETLRKTKRSTLALNSLTQRIQIKWKGYSWPRRLWLWPAYRFLLQKP
jgi:hypothetical protein